MRARKKPRRWSDRTPRATDLAKRRSRNSSRGLTPHCSYLYHGWIRPVTIRVSGPPISDPDVVNVALALTPRNRPISSLSASSASLLEQIGINDHSRKSYSTIRWPSWPSKVGMKSPSTVGHRFHLLGDGRLMRVHHRAGHLRRRHQQKRFRRPDAGRGGWRVASAAAVSV